MAKITMPIVPAESLVQSLFSVLLKRSLIQCGVGAHNIQDVNWAVLHFVKSRIKYKSKITIDIER